MPAVLKLEKKTPPLAREIAALYLNHASSSMAASTLAGRCRVLQKYVDVFGDQRCADLRPADLYLWLARQKNHWQSNWTACHFLDAIKACFNWALRLELIERNPYIHVSVAPGQPRREMTELEWRGLMRHAPACFRRLLLFLWYSGARPGEAAAMRWPCVDWDQGIIVLQVHKTARKTGRPRVIVLLPVLVALLQWLCRARKTAGRTDADHVFLTARNRPWTRFSLSHQFRRLRRLADVASDCHLYGARHAFGTRAVLNGMPIKLVAEAMGHSSVRVTERFYVHVHGAHSIIRQNLLKFSAKRQNATTVPQ